MHSTPYIYAETPKICSSAAWNQRKPFQYFVLRDFRVPLLLSFCNGRTVCETKSLSIEFLLRGVYVCSYQLTYPRACA